MKPRIFSARLSFPLASAIAAMLAAPSAEAANDSWNVDAAGNWTTFGSWLSGTQAPGSTTLDNTDIATFNNTLTAGRIVTVDATRFIGGIGFGNTSAFGFTLSGGSLNLNSGGVIQTLAGNGNHTDTISSPITISGTTAATAAFTANATSATSLLSIGAVTGSATAGNTTTLTLNGTNTGLNSVAGIIGDGAGTGKLALTKADAGTWLLSGQNTFTGDVNITGGTLIAGVSASGTNTALGNAVNTRTITIGSGANLNFSAANVLSTNFSASALPSLIINGGTVTNNSTSNNALGNVTLAGGTLTGTNGHLTYGAFNLNGTITSSGTSTISASGNGRMILNSSGANNVDTATGINVVSDTLTISAILGDLRVAESKISGINKSGAGTLVLSAANTFTGSTTVTAGNLTLSNALALQNSALVTTGAGTVTLSGHTAPTFGGLSGASGNLASVISNYSTVTALTLNPSVATDSFTYGGVIANASGNVSLTKTGAGTQVLNGAAVNSFTGGLNVNRGTLTLDYNNLATPTNLVAATNALQINGGVLTITGKNAAAATTAQTFASTSLGAGVNTVNIAKGASATSATLNLGALTVNTGAVTTFIPTTAWTTTASATEIVKISAGGSVPTLPSGATTAFVNAGVFTRNSASVGALRLAAVNSSGQLLQKANAGNLAAATGVDPTGSYQLAAGSIALTNTGASIYGLLLNATGAGTNITVANSGTLTLNSVIQIKATESVNIIPGTGISNVVIGSERNLVLAMDNAAGLAISAPIVNNGGGASAVTIVGTAPSGTPGAVTLSGANTFTGKLSVVNSQLNIATINDASANGVLGNSALSVNLGGSAGQTGTLAYTGNTAASTKPFTLATGGTGAFNVSTSAQTLTLTGLIDGGGGLTKTGAGVLILSGANTYSGDTTQATGTELRGSVVGASLTPASPFGTSTINLGGFLGVRASGTLSTTAETVTFGNNVVVTGNSTIDVNRPGATSTTKTMAMGTLTIGNQLSVTNGNSYILSFGATTLTGNATFNPSTAASTQLVLGAIGQSGGARNITKTGLGILTLNGTNTYTGTTSISAGTLSLTGSLTGGGAISTSSTGILTQSSTGVISGASSFTQGSAALTSTLAGSNTYTGTTSITDGTLSLTGSLNGGGALSTSATGIFSGSATSVISGASSVTLNGVSGTTNNVLNGLNTFTGGFTIGSGALLAVQTSSTGTLGSPTTSAFGAGSTAAIIGNSTIRSTTTVDTEVSNTLTFAGNLIVPTNASEKTLTFSGPATLTGNRIFTVDVGTTVAGKSFTLSGNIGESGGAQGITKTGTGNMVLSGDNSYTGATLISAGTLTLSGAGDINSSSGITVNGSGVKLLQTSSVAVSPSVTLTQGTLTGNGTVGIVNVGAGTGGIISNNDGVAGAALTIGNLTLSGAANLNLFSNSVAADLIVTGTLTTGATPATLTANNAGGWADGTPYTLLTFSGGSIAGSGDNFTKVINNLVGRQVGTWNTTSSAITLTTAAGDNPVWSGANGGTWTTAATNSPTGATPNWALKTGLTTSDFWVGDKAEFNDTYDIGAGPVAPITTTVDISTANVSPSSTVFNNSSVNYTLGSTGGFGIATGSLTKNGSGSLTINNANTYTGTTTLNGGILRATTSAAALGAGTLTLTGGELQLANNTGLSFGRNTTVTGNAQITSDTLTSVAGVTHTLGTLSIGGQTLTIAKGSNATGTTAGVTFGATTLTGAPTFSIGTGSALNLAAVTNAGNSITLTGAGNFSQTGTLGGGGGLTMDSGFSGTATLSGTGTNYSGVTTISGGKLVLSSTSAFASTMTVNTGGTLQYSPSGTNSQSGVGAISLLGTMTYAPATNSFQTVGTSGANKIVTVSGGASVINISPGGTFAASTGGLYLDGGLQGSSALTVNATTNGFGLVLRTSGSTYSGTMTVNGNASTIPGTGSGLVIGFLATSANATLPNANLTINGTLELGNSTSGMGWAAGTVSGQTFGMDALNGTGVIVANMATAASTRTISVGNNGGTGSFSGVIANGTNNTLSFTKNGTGTQTLSGPNTYTGATAINNGTITLSGSGTLGTGSALTLGGGKLDLGTLGITVGAVSITAPAASGDTILNGSLTGTSYAASNTTGNAIISANLLANGAAGFTKTGAGTATLSGLSATAANNYSGITTVDNGTLAFTTTSPSLTGGLRFGSAATNTTPGILDLTTTNATFVGALLVNTNSATASEIKIGAAQTLTFNGNVQIGATAPAVASTVTKLNMTGGGVFNVATAAAGTFTVGGSTSTTLAQDTTLDLTALSATTINTSTTGTLRVNPSGATNLTGAKATLLLPAPVVADTVATATLTAGTIAVGNSALFNSQAGQINTLQLGTGLTTLNANTINVGTGARDIGQVIFGGAGGDVIIRAADGTSRATLIAVGTGGATTATTEATTNNLVDFSGHDTDILVTSLNVGNQARAGALTSEFKFGTGNGSLASVLDATNVNIGFRTGTAGSSQALTNRVNLSGGTVTFGNVGATGTGVDIGNSTYSGGGTASTIGELNISGGTVTIYNGSGGYAVRLGSNVAAGGGTVTASMNLTGGTTTLGGDIIRGTISPRTTSTVKISGGTLDMGGFNIGTSSTDLITLTAESGALRNVASINGTGGLTKTTAGTLTLSGTNAYTGTTDVANGTLALSGGTNILADTNAVNVSNAAGIFDISAITTSETIGSLAGVAGSSVELGSKNLTVGGAANTNFAGVISGTNGTFTKSGALTQTLSGNNTYSGGTNINGGTLEIAHANALSTAGTISFGGGTLKYGTGITTDLSSRFSTAASQAYKIDTNGNDVTLGTGLDSTSGTLTKSGAGRLTIGTSAYTGATTVNGGTLAINGNVSTAITVNSGGTLGGNGSIGGSVTVLNGGTFAAGNSIESITTGALSLDAGSTFAYEIDNDAAAGVAGDLTAVTGNLTLDLANLTNLTLGELGAGTWTIGEKLTLISYSGTWNGGLFDYGGTLADDSTFSFSGMTWLFDYNDTTSSGSNYTGDLTGSTFVTMTAVPEPNVAALLGGLGVLALLRRRRN